MIGGKYSFTAGIFASLFTRLPMRASFQRDGTDAISVEQESRLSLLHSGLNSPSEHDSGKIGRKNILLPFRSGDLVAVHSIVNAPLPGTGFQQLIGLDEGMHNVRCRNLHWISG